MTAELFTTPTCGYCRMAKDYLKKLGVSVNEKDITKDPRNMLEFERRVGAHSGVPVIFLKGAKIIGFDRNKINNILGI
jgi:glutaredoxin